MITLIFNFTVQFQSRPRELRAALQSGGFTVVNRLVGQPNAKKSWDRVFMIPDVSGMVKDACARFDGFAAILRQIVVIPGESFHGRPWIFGVEQPTYRIYEDFSLTETRLIMDLECQTAADLCTAAFDFEAVMEPYLQMAAIYTLVRQGLGIAYTGGPGAMDGVKKKLEAVKALARQQSMGVSPE